VRFSVLAAQFTSNPKHVRVERWVFILTRKFQDSTAILPFGGAILKSRIQFSIRKVDFRIADKDGE
jgi:hypothetical protein